MTVRQGQCRLYRSCWGSLVPTCGTIARVWLPGPVAAAVEETIVHKVRALVRHVCVQQQAKVLLTRGGWDVGKGQSLALVRQKPFYEHELQRYEQ